jgi:hypothetical protein
MSSGFPFCVRGRAQVHGGRFGIGGRVIVSPLGNLYLWWNEIC